METTYITFGQDHKHIIGDRTYDKDCIATISCANASEGRQLTVDVFGDKFCTTYHEEDLPEGVLRHFPRGFLAVVLPKKEVEEKDIPELMGELSIEYHKSLIKLRREFIRKTSALLRNKDGRVSLADLSRMEVNAFSVECSSSILETKMLIDNVGKQIGKPEVAKEVLVTVVAQQMENWTSEIMPEILGFKTTAAVLEKLMENKLKDMEAKTEH